MSPYATFNMIFSGILLVGIAFVYFKYFYRRPSK